MFKLTPKLLYIPCIALFFFTIFLFQQIEKLAELMPGRAEKAAILDGMAATFKTRNMERRNSVSIKDMLEKYPHFKNYDGEVVCILI